VWDFERCTEDVSLAHGADVKTVAWHPQKAVLVSGDRGSLIHLWDPKSGKCLSTLTAHKNSVVKIAWNSNGNWFVRCTARPKTT
jgi:polyadenylation factor subunit 2